MSALDGAAGAAANDEGACDRCQLSGREVQWSAELEAAVCVDCLAGGPTSPTSPVSSETAVPRSSVLVPCPTAAEPTGLGEVEELLLKHAAGEWAPLPVPMPSLPPAATPAVRLVGEFYATVRGLRLSVGQDEPVPFAVRWVQGHTGLPRESVSRALKQLVEAGVLVRAEALPARRHPRGTQCYVPGDVPASPRRDDELAARRRTRSGCGDA